jgi:hypothetical protein
LTTDKEIGTMGTKGHAKDAKELKALAEASPAIREVQERSKHWLAFPTDRSLPPVTIPKTPSDWRSLENCKAALRRAGVEIPHRGGKR